MTLRYVTLILDAYDATGAYLTGGSASIAPNTVLAAPADTEWVPQAPVTAVFSIFSATPQVKLLATDNADITPSGWAYTVTFAGVAGNPAAFSFFVPAGPLTFTATNASPCVFTVTGTPPVNNAAVTLAGGSLPAGFNSATTYYVVNQAGATFQLAATLAGAPLGSTGSGSGTATVTSYHLSAVTPLSTPPAVVQYLPVPAGTAVAGYVPQATGSGENSTWVSVAAASLPLTTLGDTLYENAVPAFARLPGNTSSTKNFLTQTGTGSVSAAPAWATIQVADVPALPYAPLASPAFTGNPTAPTQSAGDNSTKLATTAYADANTGKALELTGATAATRYVGGTTSGSPGSGTFAKGDFVIDQTGTVWICTTAGSPGTWTQVSGGSSGPQGLWQPSVNGLLAATMDLDIALLNFALGGGAGLATGDLYLIQLLTYTSITFSKVWAWQATAATTPTYMAMGVYNFSGTRLAATSDQSATGWTAFQTGVSLSGSVTASPASPVWIGILCVAASGPGKLTGFGNAGLPTTINQTAATYRTATNGTGLSTLPSSITPSSNATFPSPILAWVGVST